MKLKSALTLVILLVASGTLLCPRQSFAEPRVRRNVEVEFETIPGASLYEIQITRKDDKSKKPQRFKSNTPQWSANVKPGLYLMQTRAYDDRGAPGEWSPPVDLKVRLPAIIVNAPAPDSVIKAKNQDWETAPFSWEVVPGAKRYRVSLQGEGFKEDHEVSEPRWEGRVPVGKEFTWNAVAIDENGEDGESSAEPYKIKVHGPPLIKPEIEKPYSKFVQELNWSKSEHADRYSYTLSRYNSKTKTWSEVEKVASLATPKAVLDIHQPSGRYRMAVQAHGAHREDSPKSQIDFYMEGGFKSQEEFDKAQLRDGITKPTRYYAIASYLATKVHYTGVNYDSNSTPTFDATGGTGRLGLGYQPKKSLWGGFVIGDLSGFIIHGQNFKFASGEFHVTRKLEFGQGGLVQFGTGLFSKELPILTGTAGEGFAGVGKVRTNGAHAGFTYWQPLKARYGLQLNARAYYGLMGSANGQSIQPALSYQYGLLGSYRLDRTTTGYAGYAYRKDKTDFTANSSDPSSYAYGLPGRVNSITLEGHYLNLILEFSF